MAEYIEREATRRAIENADPAFCYCIDYVPTADVVEVVRCKDCKHAYINSFSRIRGIAMCNYWTKQADGIPIKTKHNDFCSYGERREGE